MCPDVYYVTSDQKSIDFNCTSQVFENQWSSWTTCSSSCGLLVTNRTREYCNFSAACIGNASCGDSMFLFDMMEHPLGDSLAILNVLYNEFAIGFDLFFNDTSISTSVFLFADGWGSIMTLIDLNNDNLKITVGGNTFDSKVILNTWNSITVLQQYINSSYYNAINVNGFESPSVQNLNPNVGLLACPYTGSSFENDHYKIMNLYIVSKMQDVSKCNSLKAPCSWSNAVSLYINGSYVCSCSEGWILDQDNSSCIAVESTIAALTTTSSAPTATTYISTTTTDTPTTTTASLITTNAVPTTTTGALAATISAPTSTTAAPTTASADPATTSSASTITAAQAMTTAAHTNTIKTFTATPALTTITAALTIATAALTINATPTAIAVAQITTSITTVSSLTTLTTAKPITATNS